MPLCKACKDDFEPLPCDHKGCDSPIDSHCRECHFELFHDILLDQTLPICSGGREGFRTKEYEEGTGPWQENAIRHLEGD